MVTAVAAPVRHELWELDSKGVGTLRPHPGQAHAWFSTKRWIIMLAGTQGGKTSFGPHWLNREIKTKGPGDYLAATATFPLLENKIILELQKTFVCAPFNSYLP